MAIWRRASYSMACLDEAQRVHVLDLAAGAEMGEIPVSRYFS
jgi:hypothetical protein